MTLRHFQIFVAVCDTMNMTAAAQSLFMSQSAVSQAVAELERYYDVRLFERLSRKLYRTRAGEKLLSYARHMLGMNAEIEKDMKALREYSVMRIGASVTVGASVLPKLAAAFMRQHPETRIEVVEDNTRQVEQLILQDGVDIGLVEGETTSLDVVCRPFMQDELVLVCGKQHRFGRLTKIAPHELENEAFIIREKGSGTRKTFEDVMTAHGLSWKATWTCNNADTIKMAVAENLGVSVISKRSAENEIASGLLSVVTVDSVRFERTFKIIHHKNKYLTGPMHAFMDFCAAAPAGT
ncbi:LysR family transcriptional regulator [Ethanoligenens harbinense]|uniref:Transcriptional regulator, LysR family n=1 Tax=Ethanoligenens harbinense (strain DSM 18485 / JCM 12961 / CGMCC 1.5033 / YUAN-3) TaxID=663278 RepID=E6U9J1_ETHHY|nr:LysR family transcriptional regulator [Ethanoligenens harbinense]ADU26182.1 transcriptional regulator, LysR family [Ethanoligenens harbinense YUAN-3]AVQ95321.1 LysR family transcriptional regulator [Ethanoligenens harbinense YUAN-3]AYF37986.1 LysR family transcriptional regulator [Ethanoligenens harbinense]AYF40732.1 LysR family transcriptional regulator [Ethanoligenens harbinense]QCN91565.1 LysR family transcriptional regulator [Ethanoligenens harbinense]